MSKRTVLITGAGGFIGGRVAEVFHTSGWATVRAGVRRWSSAARLGRLPIEIVPCDVTDAEQVRAAMEGVDAVVHCAVGGPEVTVGGTRTVMETAQRLGVGHVVHLSTIDVYGDASGTVTEATAVARTGSAYGDSKVDAEEVCREFIDAGVPITVLRPTLVYGPFSANWTMLYAERLTSESWFLPEAFTGGRCNLVYVDDLVQAIARAVVTPEAAGAFLNVNGPDDVTWHQYFTALNDAMGLPPLTASSPAHSKARARLMMPARKLAKFLLTHFRGPIMGLGQSSVTAKAAMRRVEGMIRKTPVPMEFERYQRTTSYDGSRAATTLGYVPQVPMTEGVALSAQWLRHHGFGPPLPSLPVTADMVDATSR